MRVVLGGLFKRHMHHFVVHHPHHHAIFPLQQGLDTGIPQAGGQDPVVGAGGAASLVVAGDGDPGLLTGDLLQLVGDAVGDGGVGVGLLLPAAPT